MPRPDIASIAAWCCVLFAVGTAPGVASPANAGCYSFAPDNPGYCSCADLSGEWPLSPVPGDPSLTGFRTIGTKTTCYRHRGQAYWQIQKGYHSGATVDFIGWLYQVTGFPLPGHNEEAWCSEGVAYWHYAAEYPYQDGYSDGLLHPTPILKNTTQLREWYQAEALLRILTFGLYPGRGWWVSGTQLDYGDFRPGETGPCPGAYMQMANYNASTGAWSNHHSVLIDSMTVCINSAGDVERIDAQFLNPNQGNGVSFVDLDGNSASQAHITGSTWSDLYDRTIMGTTTGKMIRGWGIPLTTGGNPDYDPARIDTVVCSSGGGPWTPWEPEPADSVALGRFASFYNANQGSPLIAKNSPYLVTGERLPSRQSPWVFPTGPQHPEDPVRIEIDFLADHPWPADGVTLRWKGGRIPGLVKVGWASSQGASGMAQRPFPNFDPPQVPDLPEEVPFGGPPVFLQKLSVAIPLSAMTQNFELVGLHPSFVYGEEDEPIGTVDDDTGTVGVAPPAPSERSRFLGAAPNPTGGGTEIRYSAPGGVPVTLRIHDVHGRVVQELANAPSDAGRQTAFWNGEDAHGHPAPSGVYFVRMEAGAESHTTKIVLRK
ncbi:MAG: T9SS type A sorting domain-containing protein [Gemmatimonadota bacterium]|jgi:hypothetical protein|nr:T9SS type A sorting domain-containing protein [Gemmatimonadota bacterium]MDP6803122.1 T9SS type A sorting domain-containing protein [Gemmatimonadota bacterium]MDP7031901.1 T9SS type A sorting domain-containing protein [Gemmatimonadota bacterium]